MIMTNEKKINLPGINIKKAVSQLSNSFDLFYDLTIRFYNRYKTIIETIDQAFENNDMKLVHQLIHTIKSLSGNIGAEKLQNITSQLESAIQQKIPERIQYFWQEFKQEFTIVMHSVNQIISTYQPSSDNHHKKTILIDSVILQLKRIDANLKDFDADAHSIFKELEKSLDINCLPVSIHDQWTHLKTSIESYQFDDAIHAIKKILIGIENVDY